MRFGPLQFSDNVLLNLNKTQSRMENTAAQLSSGLRINSAADDPSGLAIAESMKSVAEGLQQGQQSVQTANNALTVADGAMQSITGILQRMRSLVVEANSDVNSASDKANIQAELDQLSLEINRIAENANFNGKKLLDGSLSTATSQPAKFQYLQNPNTDNGSGGVSPPPGPPLADPTNTNVLPSSEQITFSFSVDSYDASTNQLNVSYTAESVDPSFGPKQTGSFQVTPGSNYPTVLGPPGVPPFQLQIVDQNLQQVMNFAFNNINQNDVGKSAIMTSIPTQNLPPGHALEVNVGVTEGDTVSMQIGAMDAYNIGAYGIQVGDTLMNQGSEGRVDYAIEYVNGQRAQLGAQEVALNYASDNAATQMVNTVASESSIRDLNVAQAVGDFTKEQILTSVGTSVLSQMEVSTALMTNLLIGALGAQTVAASASASASHQ
jgi:flagellin